MSLAWRPRQPLLVLSHSRCVIGCRYAICILASDAGAPFRSSVIRVLVSVTNVPFQLFVVNTTGALALQSPGSREGNQIGYSNGPCSLTVRENGEAATLVDHLEYRVNGQVPTDCAVTDWQFSACLQPDRTVLPVDWANRSCRRTQNDSLGTAQQSRYIVSLRDAGGLGADCPRTNDGNLWLNNGTQTCGETLCPTTQCELATDPASNSTWIPLASCWYPNASTCELGQRLYGQIVQSGPNPQQCNDGSFADVCPTGIRQYAGTPCPLSGILASVPLWNAFRVPSDPSVPVTSWPRSSRVSAFLNANVLRPPMWMVGVWQNHTFPSPAGSIVNLRVAQCQSRCSSSPTRPPDLFVGNISPAYSSPPPLPPPVHNAETLMAQSPRNGFLRNHPILDVWRVMGQWRPRQLWGGLQRPSGMWSSAAYTSRFGTQGVFLNCTEQSTVPSSTQTSDCVVHLPMLLEGNNTLSFRAVAANSTTAPETMEVKIVSDTDAPLAVLVSGPGACSITSTQTPCLVSNSTAPFAVLQRDQDTSFCEEPFCLTAQDLPNCNVCSRGSPITLLCRLDGDEWGAFEPCPMTNTSVDNSTLSTIEFTSLTDGLHHVDITAMDAAGNSAYGPVGGLFPLRCIPSCELRTHQCGTLIVQAVLTGTFGKWTLLLQELSSPPGLARAFLQIRRHSLKSEVMIRMLRWNVNSMMLQHHALGHSQSLWLQWSELPCFH